ncbi:MAG: hypothetical protein K9L86_05730 [Candidatus Omnitrophica bacterium]|nr:hypothetical protein [Candidatus Omnitrophota bacterium]
MKKILLWMGFIINLLAFLGIACYGSWSVWAGILSISKSEYANMYIVFGIVPVLISIPFNIFMNLCLNSILDKKKRFPTKWVIFSQSIIFILTPIALLTGIADLISDAWSFFTLR